MRISSVGKNLIKSYEGCRLRAYLCPAGVWTIGYGSTGPHVYKGKVITKAEADALLDKDLVRFEKGVLQGVAPAIPNQNEFDAMVSLAFNIGVAAFKKSSIARQFKLGNKAKAANAFSLYVKGGGKVLPGLVRRRAEEKALFLTGANLRTVERHTSATKTVKVPEASVVPQAPKSLAASREVIGGGVVGTGGVLQMINGFSTHDASEIKNGLEDVKHEQGFIAKLYIPEIASFLVVLLSGFIIWKRFKDRKEGVR
jgi:lysozyme